MLITVDNLIEPISACYVDGLELKDAVSVDTEGGEVSFYAKDMKGHYLDLCPLVKAEKTVALKTMQGDVYMVYGSPADMPAVGDKVILKSVAADSTVVNQAIDLASLMTAYSAILKA